MCGIIQIVMIHNPETVENMPPLPEEILHVTLDHLKERWFDDDVGIVAASLVTDKRIITATSTYVGNGKWNHAECNALSMLEKDETIDLAVVNLSPCTSASHIRIHEPCSLLLEQHKVKRAHVGWMDIKQEQEANRAFDFDVELSSNYELQIISKNLYDLFGEFAHLRGKGNPWVEIKRIIGYRPFEVYYM